MAVGFRGFLGRIAIFLGLIFGYVISWLADLVFGQTSNPTPAAADPGPHDRVDWSAVSGADWFGFPSRTVEGLVGNQTEAGNLAAVYADHPDFPKDSPPGD